MQRSTSHRRIKAPLALLSASALIALSSMNCSGCRGSSEGDNTDPTIVLDVQQSELTYTVGSIVTIEVQGSDADGDGLYFEYEARTQNELSTVSSAMWFTTPNSATFRWTPDSPDVTADEPIELIFIVKDDRGGYVDRKVTLNIRPGNGDPRFEGSFNELYKDCCEKPLSLEIRVRDDDSESVELQMESGPTGAEFSPIGKDGSITRGRFLWKPDATQAKQRVHSATFVANDGSSQPVRQNLTIIIPPEGEFGIDLRNDNAFDSICASDNVIEYLKLVPERVNLSSEPSTETGSPNQNAVLIEAKLTDSAKATYDSIFLDWKLKDPLLNADPVCEDPTSPECMKKTEEERKSLQIEQTEGPDGKVSWLVTYELYFEDDEKTYLYRVCAIDNDLDADNPNKIVCSPLGQPMFYSFRTYRDATASCAEEPAEQFGGGNDDFSTAQRISVDNWDRGFTCAGNPDFYTVEVKPGAKLKPSIVYSPDQDIQVKLYDSNKQDISSQLNVPSCGGIVSAEFEVPSTASESKTYYFEVRGDEAIYHIQTIALQKAPEDACVDDSIEPNDTAAKATPLPTATTEYAVCTGDDIDLYKVDLTAGDKLDLTMRFPSNNIADMTLFKPSQSDAISKLSTGDAFTFEFQKSEEPLSYVAKECGTHYVLVFSADGTSAGNYSLESTLGKAACQDMDAFASTCNHGQSTAQLVSPDTSYDALTVCPENEDWFKRAGSGGLTLLGELTASQGDIADLSFEIYNQSGEKVATGTQENGAISLEYDFPNDDFHYLRVVNDSEDTAATYSMYFTLIAP